MNPSDSTPSNPQLTRCSSSFLLEIKLVPNCSVVDTSVKIDFSELFLSYINILPRKNYLYLVRTIKEVMSVLINEYCVRVPRACGGTLYSICGNRRELEEHTGGMLTSDTPQRGADTPQRGVTERW